MKQRTRTVLLTLSTCLAVGTALGGDTTVPPDTSIVYYKIGGAEPVSGPANPATTPIRLGLGGAARLDYSCGRFDMGLTVDNLVNQFAQAGTAVTEGVRAGIAALPLYVLQRASPGLYELFQTYRAKAEAEWNLALQSCEAMEAQIKQGGDPYAEWIGIAKGERWKHVSVSTRDAVTAKQQVETDGGVKGLTWIGGQARGGRNQPAIEVIRDITQAGYNVTMNRAPAASPTAVFAPDTKLGKTFPTPKTAADWAVSVLGDRQVALCDEVACQAKASTPGSGLLPRYEAERPAAQMQLQAVLDRTGPSQADLDKASAPGVSITPELVDVLKRLPGPERQMAMSRLAMEVAQARVIDKALLVRNLLLTGGGVPEAGWEPAQRELRERVAQLNRQMDDLLFETRMRREVVSTTARELLQAHRTESKSSTSARQQDRTDARPMEDGRVR